MTTAQTEIGLQKNLITVISLAVEDESLNWGRIIVLVIIGLLRGTGY